jgi:hypothetical protein
MNTPARLLNIAVRPCGGGALALGLAFWLGYASSLCVHKTPVIMY